jgi:hypothetical protein
MWQCQNHSPGLLAWNLITMNELASMTCFWILSLIFFRWGRVGELVFCSFGVETPASPRLLSATSTSSLSATLLSPPGRVIFYITVVHSRSIKRVIEREEASDPATSLLFELPPQLPQRHKKRRKTQPSRH